jgi:hypothetical protein
MTTVNVLAALLVIAASIFAILALANLVRVIPRRPDPQPLGISWKVDFRLWFPAWRGGYIVQHVRIRERVTDCGDPAFAHPYIDKSAEFWEAWQVRPVRARPEPAPPPAPAHDSDDMFGFGIPHGELGMGRGRVRLEVRGQVRFFPGVTLPATFIRNNPATQAGHALSDRNRPPFWRPGGTRHDLTAEWEACPAPQQWKLVEEVPKFRG